MRATYCPMCGPVVLTRVLTTVEMTAEYGRQPMTSTGLQAFQCENAHVFFLRAADVGLYALAASAR